MNQWICNTCQRTFDEPLWLPRYVDDSMIKAYSDPVCPYCCSDDIDEYWSEDPEDEDEPV